MLVCTNLNIIHFVILWPIISINFVFKRDICPNRLSVLEINILIMSQTSTFQHIKVHIVLLNAMYNHIISKEAKETVQEFCYD